MLESIQTKVIFVECILSKILHVINGPTSMDIILLRAPPSLSDKFETIITSLRETMNGMFICVYGESVGSSPFFRYWCFQKGVSMVTADAQAIHSVVTALHDDARITGRYTCPFCSKTGLTEDQLWRHCPLYHINEVNAPRQCPICKYVSKRPFQVHMHNTHGPPGRGDAISEFNIKDTVMYAFSLVICRHPVTKKFLLVQVCCFLNRFEVDRILEDTFRNSQIADIGFPVEGSIQVKIQSMQQFVRQKKKLGSIFV